LSAMYYKNGFSVSGTCDSNGNFNTSVTGCITPGNWCQYVYMSDVNICSETITSSNVQDFCRAHCDGRSTDRFFCVQHWQSCYPGSQVNNLVAGMVGCLCTNWREKTMTCC
jgi:hypothetical protein